MISPRLMVLLSLVGLVCDRVTKWFAYYRCIIPISVTSWFACDTTLNRGLSWSLATFEDPTLYTIVSCLVTAVVVWCGWYTYQRWSTGDTIHGFLLIIVGALSNVIDRWLYGGVVDFIVIHYKNWYFPTFNIADVLICIGVAMVAWDEVRK